METIGGLITLQFVEYQVGHHKFMTKPVWNDLHKTLDDQTTIEEAIAAAISTHNDDPQAHLDVNQAVEVHRDTNIADHPAKSVLNDKVHPNARNHVAIAGGDDPENFNTIDGAVAAAVSEGGGIVGVMPGTYNLSSRVDLPANISIEGTDPEDCVVNTDYANGYYFYYPTYSAGEPVTQFFRNLTVDNAGDYGIRTSTNSDMANLTLNIENCHLLSEGNKVYTSMGKTRLRDCILECTDDRAIVYRNTIVIEDTEIRPFSTYDSPRIFSTFSSTVTQKYVKMRGCELLEKSAATPNWWQSVKNERILLRDCYVEGSAELQTNTSDNTFENNEIYFNGSSKLHLTNIVGETVQDNIASNNRLYRVSTTNEIIRLGSGNEASVVVGNICDAFIDNDSTNSVVANNVIK